MWVVRSALLVLLLGSCGKPANTKATHHQSNTETPKGQQATLPAQDMQRVEAADLRWRRATPDEERSATIPASLVLRLQPEPVIVGRRVMLHATLTNPTGAQVEVVIFPVHDRTPFYVEVIATENLAMKPYDGPALPPEPPPGRVYALPAKTSVSFREWVDFDEYDARTFAGAQLRWSFQYWAEPKPGGVVTLSDEITTALASH